MKQGIQNLAKEKAAYLAKKKIVKAKDVKEYNLYLQQRQEQNQKAKEEWLERGTAVRVEGQAIGEMRRNLSVLIERMR